MADKKGKAEGNDSDDNDGTENDDSLCNRVIATLKEGGDLDSLSLKEHKAYLRNHGLRITGTKAVCQRRILEHWESDESVCNRVVAILKEGGELESLSLKELKAYLRNYGLRITGTKAVCQQRILEHWRDDTEEKEKEEDKGNNSDDNDGTENGESLCNRVITVLKEGSDLESLSLKELKAYLRNHGLHVTGTKAACQQRILEHWENDESVCKRVVTILKEGGDLESLSSKELKAYLRNHGLSITGSKAVCQQRILEHWSGDETKEEEEEKGNDLDDLDQMQNSESLCNRVIAILKEGGDLESLSLKELKAYLRNHGLRIAGTKAVCQQRILEHWSGDETEEEEEDEDEGNNLDDNDQTENDKSLCNRVIAILKEGGDLEILRSKELKAYLRNHGLLSTGTKALCQQRILEHWSGDETEEDEDEGNDSDDNDRTENDKSLCNQVIGILKEGGYLESLSLKELKAYLRNHGLLITGTKAVCQQRILEHWRIKEGNAEALYPRSSFFIDCTGDVCKGDVVLFTQKVYKKFDNMSRRRLLGKRTIAGRVVKESYGKAKQQHTFTVEVLWSKGTTKLPLLFPLLVKGRNLYKSRTYRQRWCDEAERRNVIAEKHKRGKAARLVKAMERIRKWSADVGTKHPRCLHQSRPLKNRRPSKRERERAKIDMAHRKAFIPRLWHTGNVYQVPSPVGQLKKKQKSRSSVSDTFIVTRIGGLVAGRGPAVPKCNHCGGRHSGECWRTLGACFRCGSKDHFLRNCPRRPSATSVPSERPSATPVLSGMPRATSEPSEGLSATFGPSEKPSATSAPSERSTPTTQQDGDVGSSATFVPYERPTPTTRQDGDVGTKHPKHSHQSRRSQKRKASELEKGKIDKADGKASIPSAWNTGNMYQVSSPVGQVKKKQKSMLRVSNTSYTVTSTGGLAGGPSACKCNQCGGWHFGKCRRISGACFRCGSKDHLLRSCPRRKGATSVPSQSPTLTAHRRVRPGRKERLERKQKHVHSTEDTGVILHSNADAVLNSYQPQQSFHHQSAPHQFAGNDIGSTFHHQSAPHQSPTLTAHRRVRPGRKERLERKQKHVHSTEDTGVILHSNADAVLNSYQPQQSFHHQSAPHQFAGNDIGSTFHHQSAPHQFAGNDIGSTFHHQSAPHQFAGNDIGSTSHHQSAPHQFAGNDIGSTFHHQSAPHQFAGSDIGSTFHHGSAPHQFAGNDIGSTFHHGSAPHQFAGNDSGSTSAMVRPLPSIPYMDPQYQGFNNPFR